MPQKTVSRLGQVFIRPTLKKSSKCQTVVFVITNCELKCELKFPWGVFCCSSSPVAQNGNFRLIFCKLIYNRQSTVHLSNVYCVREGKTKWVIKWKLISVFNSHRELKINSAGNFFSFFMPIIHCSCNVIAKTNDKINMQLFLCSLEIVFSFFLLFCEWWRHYCNFASLFSRVGVLVFFLEGTNFVCENL